MRLRRIISIVSAALCIPIAHAQTPADFKVIGPFSAKAVSVDGTTVVATSSNLKPLRWRKSDGLIVLPLEGDSTGYAYDVSGDGSVIVGQHGTKGCKWVNGQTYPVTGTPLAISNDATCITAKYDGLIYLFAPGHNYAVGFDAVLNLSGDGTTACGYYGKQPLGYYWNPSAHLTGADPKSVYYARAFCLTEHAEHVYSVQYVGNSIFWIYDLVPKARVLQLSKGVVPCVADDNSILGVASSVYFPATKTLQTLPEFFQSYGLDPATFGLKALAVTAISGNGTTLVGTGVDSTGATQSWMAHLTMPAGKSDHYDVVPNQQLSVAAPGVLGNDGHKFVRPVLVTYPQHGTVQLHTDGSFTYNPDAGYLGLDNFQYRLVTGEVQSGLTTVGLHIGAISSLSLTPNVVLGGANSSGIVSLNFTPATNVTVALKSTHPELATLPSSVVVAAGHNSATFTVKTSSVDNDGNTTIAATYNAESATLNLKVYGASPQSVSLPSSIVGGNVIREKVTLRKPSPSPSTTVTLTANNPAVAKPVQSAVTVAVGELVADFDLQTQPVSASQSASISASARGGTATNTLTVVPPNLKTFGASPSTVVAGNPITITIGLDGPAAAPYPVAITPGGTKYVPAGSSRLQYTVATSGDDAPGQRDFQATSNGITLSTSVQLAAAKLVSVSGPTSVKGGQSITVTLQYDGEPTSTDQTTFGSSNPSVVPPPSPLVQAKSVVVNTKPVAATTKVSFRATYRGILHSYSFSVTP